MGRQKASSKAITSKNTNSEAKIVSGNANLSADKVELPDKSKTVTCKRVEWDPDIQVRCFYSRSTKMPGSSGTPVRRSRCLQTLALSALNSEVNSLAQKITISMSDDEDERKEDVEPSLKDRNLEEKVKYLLQVSKEHQKILKALTFKRTKGAPGEISSTGELTFRSLYNNSQKKMEALVEENNHLSKKNKVLVEENRQLHKKLEHALGKVEVYEKGNYLPSNVLEKLKGAIVFSGSMKEFDAGAYVLSETIAR